MTALRWERVKETYLQALDLPDSERDGFLALECADDPDLLSEIQELLINADGPSFLEDSGPLFQELLADRRPVEESSHVFSPGDILLGRFGIQRFIGRGGMGEVYAAVDLELGGELAIKTIRSEIADSPEGTRRLLREVRLSRQITHPNVCRVFDLEEAEVHGKWLSFFTMELLQGESLADWISREAPVAPREALPVISQFLEGLAAAHRAGIVHRDFKPGNVFLSPTNTGTRVVVTDFGIAGAQTPPESVTLTAAGQLTGTPLYMAPEQLEGNRASIASDVYAVGLVLYEIVTGIRPFQDENPYVSAFQRLKTPPVPPRRYAPKLDPVWEDTILRCLAIRPEERPESVDAVRESLSTLRPVASRRFRYLFRPKIAAAVATVVVSALAIAYTARNRPDEDMISDLVRVTSDSGITVDPAISPDGRFLVYASDRAKGNLDIWVQPLGGGEAVRLTHDSRNAGQPSFSPDGKLIAFRSERDGGGIYIVPRTGGEPRRVAPFGRRPHFSPDGKYLVFWTGQIQYSKPAGAKVFVVPVSGGPPRQIQPDFIDARYPLWSPDGKHLLFQGIRYPSEIEDGGADWWVTGVDTPELHQTHAFDVFRRLDLHNQQGPNYWDHGRVLFAALSGYNSNIWAARLSPSTWQIEGEPRRITLETATEFAPTLGPDGTLVMVNQATNIRVYGRQLGGRLSPDSDLRELTRTAAFDTRPSISADGSKVVFGRRNAGERSVFVLDVKSGQETGLTKSDIVVPIISRDGSQIAYSSAQEENNRVFVIPAAGGTLRKICDDCGDVVDWFADNQRILYISGRPRSLHMLDARTGATTTLYSDPHHGMEGVRLSPGEDWISFTESTAPGRSRIWVAPLRQGRVSDPIRWIPVTEGDSWDDKPAWAKDESALYFYSSRDGYGCIWKQDLDPRTKHPVGVAVPVQHLHQARFSLANLTLAAFNLSVSRDLLVMNVGEVNANIWSAKIKFR